MSDDLTVSTNLTVPRTHYLFTLEVCTEQYLAAAAVQACLRCAHSKEEFVKEPSVTKCHAIMLLGNK